MDVPEDGLVEGDGVATDALGDNCVRVRWDMKGDELRCALFLISCTWAIDCLKMREMAENMHELSSGTTWRCVSKKPLPCHTMHTLCMKKLPSRISTCTGPFDDGGITAAEGALALVAAAGAAGVA